MVLIVVIDLIKFIIRLIKDKCVRISVLYMCIRVVYAYTRTRVIHKSYAAEYLGNFSEVYYLRISVRINGLFALCPG